MFFCYEHQHGSSRETPPQSHSAAPVPCESSWVWGQPQHPVSAAPGAAPAAAPPCLSAKCVSFEHWCFWQLPVAKQRAQTHPTAQLVGSYLQVINKSFTVYCNHSAKTQTKSIAVTTSKAACSHRSDKQTFWVLLSEKGVYRTLGSPGSSSWDSCCLYNGVQDKPFSCQNPCAEEPTATKPLPAEALLRSSCSPQALFGRAAGNPAGLWVSPPPFHNCSEGPSP